jgi:dTDP-4-dehydrorhamnose reductase
VRILLTGRNGQVGHALERALAPAHELTARDRAALDLSDFDAIGRMVRKTQPEVIVNAAAYTAVDRAESERETAFRVNAGAVQAIGAAATDCGALVVHYSTDYVFDGEKPGPYAEEDAPRPLNVYGESKLAGERALAAAGCRYFIFRTSWVYGPRGKNFLLTILAAAREKPELRVVDDQRGAPTSSLAIASATARILSGGAFKSAPSGVYHMSAAGETSWCGFARAILAEAGIATPVTAIRTEEFPAAARRPKNSVLDNSRLSRVFEVSLAPWQDGLRAVIRELQAACP